MTLSTTAKYIVSKTAALAILCSFIFSNAALAAVVSSDLKMSASNTPATMTTDLTQLGRDGRLGQNPNLESKVEQLVEVLEKGGARQPLIVDQKEEIQQAIVEQLAIRLAKGDVPVKVKGIIVTKVEDTILFSNAKTDAEVASKINEIIDQAEASKTR